MNHEPVKSWSYEHRRKLTMKTGRAHLIIFIKNWGAPMVKIKDFTIGSKNLGGHVPPPPCPTQLPPMVTSIKLTTVFDNYFTENLTFKFYASSNQWSVENFLREQFGQEYEGFLYARARFMLCIRRRRKSSHAMILELLIIR